MIKPIRPVDVAAMKARQIPEEVIDIINQILAKNFNNGSATVYQEEIVDALVEHMDVTREEVFSNRWLDIETLYRAQGWNVHYDKPAYNENYKPYFKFTVNKSYSTPAYNL